MTIVDRPLLRALVRANGRDKTLRIIESARRMVAVSRGVMGLMPQFDEGQGFEIKASNGRMTGVLTYDGTSVVKWTDGVLDIWRKQLRDVPMTVLQGMLGRPVTDLIAWDLLDAGMTITDIRETGINFRVDLSNTTVFIDDAVARIPAGDFD